VAPGRGFSLIETIIAIGILSVMYVAALNAVGSSRLAQQTIADNRRGFELAQELLAEVLQQNYWDPTALSGLGPDAGESATTHRTSFDDVDDYANLIETTIKTRDGTAIPNLTNWNRFVYVVWVSPNNLDQVSGGETGAKRIVVGVTYKGKTVAWLDAIRANVD